MIHKSNHFSTLLFKSGGSNYTHYWLIPGWKIPESSNKMIISIRSNWGESNDKDVITIQHLQINTTVGPISPNLKRQRIAQAHRRLPSFLAWRMLTLEIPPAPPLTNSVSRQHIRESSLVNYASIFLFLKLATLSFAIPPPISVSVRSRQAGTETEREPSAMEALGPGKRGHLRPQAPRV